MYELCIKRVYLSASDSDGYRILVDRLWPRGIQKAVLKLDKWNKDIAPSDGLRKKFGHNPDAFAAFKTDYTSELNRNISAKQFAADCRDLLEKNSVTLLFAAKDTEHNNAVVLREWILSAI